MRLLTVIAVALGVVNTLLVAPANALPPMRSKAKIEKLRQAIISSENSCPKIENAWDADDMTDAEEQTATIVVWKVICTNDHTYAVILDRTDRHILIESWFAWIQDGRSLHGDN